MSREASVRTLTAGLLLLLVSGCATLGQTLSPWYAMRARAHVQDGRFGEGRGDARRVAIYSSTTADTRPSVRRGWSRIRISI